MLLLTLSAGSYAQFIAVLVIFVLVLAVTAGATKWMANYQKAAGVSRNIEVIETTRVANNKYVSIVRVGKTYRLIAIGKDTITDMGEIEESQIDLQHDSGNGFSFKSMFDKALNKANVSSDAVEESKNEEV